MLIDIHCHSSCTEGLCRPNGKRYPKPQELVEMMDALSIDKAVLLSTVSPEFRYSFVTPEEVHKIWAEYPQRFIPFCSLDPRMLTNSPDADFRPMLEYYKEHGFKGVGEYIPNLPFDDPLNLNVFKQVEEIGLPLTFHIAPAIGGHYGCYDELGLPRLERVLAACPKLVFLAHSQSFWSEISADVTEKTRHDYPKGKVEPGRAVELFRRYENLHGDLSAGSGYNAISRDPDFGYGFLEEFQDRLYFATDIANVPQKTPIVPYFEKLRQEKLIPEAAYNKITSQNAVKLFDLDLGYSSTSVFPAI